MIHLKTLFLFPKPGPKKEVPGKIMVQDDVWITLWKMQMFFPVCHSANNSDSTMDFGQLYIKTFVCVRGCILLMLLKPERESNYKKYFYWFLCVCVHWVSYTNNVPTLYFSKEILSISVTPGHNKHSKFLSLNRKGMFLGKRSGAPPVGSSLGWDSLVGNWLASLAGQWCMLLRQHFWWGYLTGNFLVQFQIFLSSNEHFYLWNKETFVCISYQASYTLHMAPSLECLTAVWSLVQALMFTHFTSYI